MGLYALFSLFLLLFTGLIWRDVEGFPLRHLYFPLFEDVGQVRQHCQGRYQLLFIHLFINGSRRGFAHGLHKPFHVQLIGQAQFLIQQLVADATKVQPQGFGGAKQFFTVGIGHFLKLFEYFIHCLFQRLNAAGSSISNR